jgi:hypothetical protein
MGEEEVYYAQVEAELGNWDGEIRKLRDNTRNVAEGTEMQYYEQVEDLIALYELAQQKLQELKESEKERWPDFRASMDAALRNLKKSHDFLMKHFT